MRDQAIQIVTTLVEHGHKAVFAGGCVRDMLLGRDSKDIDIATSATPEQVSSLFPNVIPVGAAFGVCVVVIDGISFEVATFRKDGEYSDGRRPDSVELTCDLREDAARRDFTMNSLFFNPLSDEVVDFFEGEADLRNERIVAVGDPQHRIAEDKLRMLRAVRFVAQLGFDLDERLAQSISSHASQIADVSPERIREELFKICAAADPVKAFRLMQQLGLLRVILPEVDALVGCEQDPVHHPEGDAWTHSLGVVKTLKENGAAPLLVFAGLLHDIGKHQCRQIRVESGQTRISNFGHDLVGAEMVAKIARRLRMTNQDSEKLVELVKQHMRAHRGPEMKQSTLVSFLRHLSSKQILHEQVLLQFADANNSGHAEKSLRDFFAEKMALLEPVLHCETLLSGNDLKKEFNLRPGPIFRSLLDIVREAQDAGVIATREEALSLLACHVPS